MTDNAERKVREWARRRNGDPLSQQDVVDLVLAVDDDGETRHKETIQRLDDVDMRHVTLCLRVSELETINLGCSERVRSYVEKEHSERHERHMASHHDSERRATDPPDAAFSDRRATFETEEEGDMLRAWRVGKWFVMAFAIFLIDIFARYVSHVLLGYPN